MRSIKTQLYIYIIILVVVPLFLTSAINTCIVFSIMKKTLIEENHRTAFEIQHISTAYFNTALEALIHMQIKNEGEGITAQTDVSLTVPVANNFSAFSFYSPDGTLRFSFPRGADLPLPDSDSFFPAGRFTHSIVWQQPRKESDGALLFPFAARTEVGYITGIYRTVNINRFLKQIESYSQTSVVILDTNGNILFIPPEINEQTREGTKILADIREASSGDSVVEYCWK